jgi:hypothetical protein
LNSAAVPGWLKRRSGPGRKLNGLVSENDGLAARLAHQRGHERVAAAVRKDRGGPIFAGQVAVAPLPEGSQLLGVS